jgi:hypothetical protein
MLTTHDSDFDPTLNVEVENYMLLEEDLEKLGDLRLLEVDKLLAIPSNTHIRLLVSSTDVLHSWAVPSFGIKVDACPGRLNIVNLFIDRTGTFYGQCSEICGINHSFMPICLHVDEVNVYINERNSVYWGGFFVNRYDNYATPKLIPYHIKDMDRTPECDFCERPEPVEQDEEDRRFWKFIKKRAAMRK